MCQDYKKGLFILGEMNFGLVPLESGTLEDGLLSAREMVLSKKSK